MSYSGTDLATRTNPAFQKKYILSIYLEKDGVPKLHILEEVLFDEAIINAKVIVDHLRENLDNSLPILAYTITPAQLIQVAKGTKIPINGPIVIMDRDHNEHANLGELLAAKKTEFWPD